MLSVFVVLFIFVMWCRDENSKNTYNITIELKQNEPDCYVLFVLFSVYVLSNFLLYHIMYIYRFFLLDEKHCGFLHLLDIEKRSFPITNCIIGMGDELKRVSIINSIDLNRFVQYALLSVTGVISCSTS